MGQGKKKDNQLQRKGQAGGELRLGRKVDLESETAREELCLRLGSTSFCNVYRAAAAAVCVWTSALARSRQRENKVSGKRSAELKRGLPGKKQNEFLKAHSDTAKAKSLPHQPHQLTLAVPPPPAGDSAAALAPVQEHLVRTTRPGLRSLPAASAEHHNQLQKSMAFFDCLFLFQCLH